MATFQLYSLQSVERNLKTIFLCRDLKGGGRVLLKYSWSELRKKRRSSIRTAKTLL